MNTSSMLPSFMQGVWAERFFSLFTLFGSAMGVLFSGFRELSILWHILVHPISGSTHKDRLESFYRSQAGGYDEYRKRLLHGREDLIALVGTRARDMKRRPVWVDMGGGTGANVEMMAELGLLQHFRKVYVVDLSGSLLGLAQKRIVRNRWRNVETVEADATTFMLPELADGADFVTFSYSLTMIPPWWAALQQAMRLLKPDTGMLGVVDFYVGRKYESFADGQPPMGYFQRTFWRLFFDLDNVHLNRDHIPFLQTYLDTVVLQEHVGKVPYMPFVRAPYYIFLGSPKAAPSNAGSAAAAAAAAAEPTYPRFRLDESNDVFQGYRTAVGNDSDTEESSDSEFSDTELLLRDYSDGDKKAQ